MNVKTNVGRLLSAVEKGSISLSLPPKVDGPLVDFGRLFVTSDSIGIKTTSSHSASECSIDLEGEDTVITPGSCALNMTKLKSILGIPKKDATVEFFLEEQKDSNMMGIVHFSIGKSKWKLPCVASAVVADTKFGDDDLCLTMDKKELLEALGSTSFASNIKDAFYTNSNICVSIKDNVAMFGATDDIRCAVYNKDLRTPSADRRFLIPIVSFSPALKSFGDGEISIYISEDAARLNRGSHSVKFSLSDESDVTRFPGFEAMIGTQMPTRIRVMSSKIIEMISACNDMNNEECLMRIDEDNVHFYAYDSKDGTAYHSQLSYAGDKASFKMGLCPMFLIEFLKKLDGEVLHMEYQIVDGEVKFMKLRDDEGHWYLMKALIDLVCVPPDADGD